MTTAEMSSKGLPIPKITDSDAIFEYQEVFSQDFQCENESEVSIKLTEEVTDCGPVFDIEKKLQIVHSYSINTM